MSREQSLTTKLADLQTQRTGAALLSAQAVVADDAKAITGARKALAEIDAEIAEVSNAIPLAKKRDQEAEEAARLLVGKKHARNCLAAAKEYDALAVQMDLGLDALKPVADRMAELAKVIQHQNSLSEAADVKGLTRALEPPRLMSVIPGIGLYTARNLALLRSVEEDRRAHLGLTPPDSFSAVSMAEQIQELSPWLTAEAEEAVLDRSAA